MVLKKYALLVLLFAVTLSACGQQKEEYVSEGKKNLTVGNIPISTIAFRLQEKVELQALELNVYKNLNRIDTVRYNNDSVIIFFKGQDGAVLKKIKEYVWEISGREDSIVSYFNKKGLLIYYELWHDGYRKIDSLTKDTVWIKTKPSFARYEYDSDGKLIRRFKLIPDEYLLDTKITYDAHENPIRDTKRKTGGRYLFWGSVKETLEK